MLLTCLLYLIVRVFKTYQVLRHNGLSVTPELLRIVLHSGRILQARGFDRQTLVRVRIGGIAGYGEKRKRGETKS